MANLTDADKVLRNDTGKDIVTQLTAIKTAIENGGGGGGSGASTVSQLTDVLLSQNIPDGDVLVRDNNLTGGKLWKNATITVELTQAEYNQLVADDEVLPDVDYYITDAPSMQGTSADLSYDGTTLSTYDKIEGLNANELPISSGIATNTKAYIDKIAPQKYRYIGELLDSNGGTVKGVGCAEITLSNGIARIDFTLRITVADATAHNEWGINRNYFTALTGKTIAPTLGGVFDYYKADGTINYDRQGYGGSFGLAGANYWKPARVYKVTSNPDTYGTGTWSDNLFGTDHIFTGICFGTYT